MANIIKSFRPAPSYELNPPPQGPIGLGSILGDVNKPKRSLNRKSREPVDKDDEYTHNHYDVQVTRSQIKERRGGILTEFLATVGLPVGLDINAHSNSGREYALTCEQIETTWFQPDNEYIHKSLLNEAVKSYGKVLFWRKPLYMITGIKVAHGVSMKSLDTTDKGLNAQIKADGTAVAAPAHFAGGGAGSDQTTMGVQWGKADDFVFAFSLIKIKRKGTDRFTEYDYAKGSLFDTEEAGEEEPTLDNFAENWEIETDDVSFTEELVADNSP